MAGKLPTKQAQHKSGRYGLFTKFAGYHAREDQTTLLQTLPEETIALVSPSQNVVTNTSGRVALVKGYTLDGPGSTTPDSGILSNYDFVNFTGRYCNLRCGFLSSAGNDGKLQYRYIDSSGDVTWNTLVSGLTNIRLSYASYFDTTNHVPICLWVDGTNNVFSWNGSLATFLSATNNTGIIGSLYPTSGGVAAAGSGYVIGDVVSISGGTGATATVATLSTTSIATAVISNSGSMYSPGNTFTFSGGTGATGYVDTVDGSGAILTWHFLSTGTGYSAGSNTTTGGTSGTHAVFTITVTSTGIGSLSLKTNGYGYSVEYPVPSATTGGTGIGATVYINSLVSNSITIQGSETWGQLGFNLVANLNIVINGTTYSYITGTGTTTIVGISPDPTLAGYSVGTPIAQASTYLPLSDMTDISSTFGPTIIGCGKDNQVYLGSSTNELYISKINDYTDYSYSTPRVSGEGYSYILSSPPIAFMFQENKDASQPYDLYIAHGNSTFSLLFLYQGTTSVTSGDVTVPIVTEKINLVPMQSSFLNVPMSQRLVTKMKNHIVFVGKNNVASFFGYWSSQFVPETVDFSYTIINDMSTYDFTDGSVFYYNNYIYIAIPKSGIIRVYNMTDQTKQVTQRIQAVEDVDPTQPWYWEAPVTYPIAGFYWTPDKGLCGHAYGQSESYQLFTGSDFNTQSINANATFAFNDLGERTEQKGSNELWVEGYIGQNTTLTVSVNHDLNNFQTQQNVTVNGNDNTIVAFGSGAHAIGKNPIGSKPLGGADISTTLPAWFHTAKTFVEQPSWYLEQISFSTSTVDQNWEIICFGTNAEFTNEGNNSITQ